MAGMAGEDRLQAFVLHHLQGRFQTEVQIHGWGEGVAVLGCCLSVGAQVQIELG